MDARSLSACVLVLLAGCAAKDEDEDEFPQYLGTSSGGGGASSTGGGSTSSGGSASSPSGYGVPVDGYPSYPERLMLVAINRVRADPNNVSLQTKAQCSADYGATPPVVLDHNGSRAARFHCLNLMKTNSGLSHKSFCTLKEDVGTTGCTGEAGCACKPGTEHFSCDTLGGKGTDMGTRASYFGFSANGEVGAAGYGDGWSAVQGWVTECANQDGHRRILTGANIDVIGLGFAAGTGCWPSYYFGDTGRRTVTLPTLVAGVHHPEHGGATTSFYVNYHDSVGVAASVTLVLDGQCHAMDKELGVSSVNLSYKATVAVSDGCHQYWFKATNSQGMTARWPAEGAYGVGTCTDYVATAMQARCN